MSATVSTPVIDVVEKKVRVPTTLPAKYGKFIQFGYYLMNKLNATDGDEDTPPVVEEKLFLNKLRIFDSLEDQQALVEEFFDSSKQLNTELRKMMQQHKRELIKAAKVADKPQKEKKIRQVKAKKSETDPDAPPVEKKVRAKKTKVTSTEDALVNELVQLASGEPASSSANPPDLASPVPSLSSKKESAKAAVAELIAEVPTIADPVKVTKPKAAKEEKPKVVKEEKPKAAKEEKPKVVKEEKPKAAKEEKPKAVKEVKPVVVEEKPTVAEEKEADDEEELQVSIFMYEGQQYLIDDVNNVYDFTSQDKIGTLVNDIIVRA